MMLILVIVKDKEDIINSQSIENTEDGTFLTTRIR